MINSKLLLVDDEPLNLKLYDKMLKDFDFQVITAANGQECLEKVNQHFPDLILLDNFSPEMVTEALALKIDIPFEVSGGINISNISLYGKTNVKYIAIGALTHSAPILDIGFDLI